MRRIYHCLWALILIATAALAPVSGSSPEADSHRQGREIYNYRCYFCHGYSGNANTLSSTFLDPAPRDFTRTEPGSLARGNMIETVTHGKPGTAMHGFSRVLSRAEISAVVDFVRDEFMLARRPNSRYHTADNGWPQHQRYRHAYPFATGKIALDAPREGLSAAQVRGRELYLRSCISCHDRAVVRHEGDIWSKQSVSYPRNRYSHTAVDAVSSASIYARHDIAPASLPLSATARAGRRLWQQNCAFCHAADGTGENWIGSFLVPKPRNLTAPRFMQSMTRELLLARIRDGLPNTSMPAWKYVLDDAQIENIISYIDQAFHALERPQDSQN